MPKMEMEWICVSKKKKNKQQQNTCKFEDFYQRDKLKIERIKKENIL